MQLKAEQNGEKLKLVTTKKDGHTEITWKTLSAEQKKRFDPITKDLRIGLRKPAMRNDAVPKKGVEKSTKNQLHNSKDKKVISKQHKSEKTFNKPTNASFISKEDLDFITRMLEKEKEALDKSIPAAKESSDIDSIVRGAVVEKGLSKGTPTKPPKRTAAESQKPDARTKPPRATAAPLPPSPPLLPEVIEDTPQHLQESPRIPEPLSLSQRKQVQWLRERAEREAGYDPFSGAKAAPQRPSVRINEVHPDDRLAPWDRTDVRRTAERREQPDPPLAVTNHRPSPRSYQVDAFTQNPPYAPPQQRTVAVVPAAMQQNFVLGGDINPDEIARRKRMEREKWMAEIAAQIEEKNRRQIESAAKWASPRLDTQTDQASKNSLSHVTNGVQFSDQSLAKRSHFSHDIPDPVRASSQPQLDSNPVPPSLGGGGFMLGARGGAPLDPVERREVDKKRAMQREHQDLVRRQMEEREESKRLQRERRLLEEAVEEQKLQRERQALQDVYDRERREAQDKEAKRAAEMEFMRLKIEEATEAARRLKAEKRHAHVDRSPRRLDESGHNAHNSRHPFYADHSPRSQPPPRPLSDAATNVNDAALLLEEQLRVSRDTRGEAVKNFSTQTELRFEEPVRSRTPTPENRSLTPSPRRDEARSRHVRVEDTKNSRRNAQRGAGGGANNEEATPSKKPAGPSLKEIIAAQHRTPKKKKLAQKPAWGHQNTQGKKSKPQSQRYLPGTKVDAQQPRDRSVPRNEPRKTSLPAAAAVPFRHPARDQPTRQERSRAKSRPDPDNPSKAQSKKSERALDENDPDPLRTRMRSVNGYLPIMRTDSVLDTDRANELIAVSREQTEMERARQYHIESMHPAKYGEKTEIISEPSHGKVLHREFQHEWINRELGDYNAGRSGVYVMPADTRQDPISRPAQHQTNVVVDPLLNPGLVRDHPTPRQGELLQHIAELRHGLNSKRKQAENFGVNEFFRDTGVPIARADTEAQIQQRGPPVK